MESTSNSRSYFPPRFAMPASDDVDRDKFYSSVDEDDGEDYELEPPDPAVLEAEKRRAEETVAATRQSIDIDAVYREADRDHAGEILNEWVRNFRPQFQIKHLLIATAVIAVLLVLWQFGMLADSLMMMLMASVFGLYMYLQWKERQYQAEAARRRQEMYDERRAAQTEVGASRPEPSRESAAKPRSSRAGDDSRTV
jgi:hypothetical protein